MSALPATHYDSDLDFDALLDELERDDYVITPTPQPDNWLKRYRESGLTYNEFNDLERAKIATKSANENGAQAQGQQAFAQDSSMGCLVVPSTSPSAPSNPSAQSTSSTPARLHVPANQNVKPWAKSSDVEKLAIASSAAEHHHGVAWSLNLSAARERALQKAAANTNDPVRLFSTYINRELKKRLGYVPPYCFVFEFTADGRLHAHGVLVMSDTSETDLIKQALMKAGGKLSGHKASRQIKLDAIHDARGWHGYITKEIRSTACRVGTDKVSFINHALGRLAREFHEPGSAPVVAVAAPVAQKTRTATQGRSPASSIVVVAVRQRLAQNAPPGAFLTTPFSRMDFPLGLRRRPLTDRRQAGHQQRNWRDRLRGSELGAVPQHCRVDVAK